jgi:hypothetical protein
MQTILIALGDYMMFGQRQSRGVIVSLGIMARLPRLIS